MKNVRLKQMKLRNFKGIAALDIDFNLIDTNIYGRNATGKTTIVDAFMWLFFNKDSKGSADFDIKTKTVEGNYVHNLEHTVEAVVEIKDITINGGNPVETKFTKLYKEKYTKQRGSTTATFTGHTTDYFVDDVPKKKKEYEEVVNQLFDSKFFQIITDPLYFNEKMKWQDRRKLLIDICGDVSDEIVISSNEELAPLLRVLGTKSIDDYRLQLKSQMKPINEELKAIPIKINEANLAIPKEVGEVDEEKLVFINNRIQELENKRVSALCGGAIAEKETELIKLQNKKLLLENEVPSNKKLKDELYVLDNQKTSLEREIQRTVSDIAFKESQQKSNEEQRSDLRKRYIELNSMEYDESQNTCPECGQLLPQEKISMFMENFNIGKSDKLESINARGVELKQEYEKRADEITILSNDVELKKRELNTLQIAINDKQKEIDNIQNLFKAEQRQKTNKVNKQIVVIEQEIAALKNDAQAVIDGIDEDIQAWKQQRAEIESIKAKINLAEVQKKRIEELEAREKELAKDYSDKEQALYITDLFIKTKVNMLTEKINKHFELCNFKLFEEQINGGLNEVCEITVDGVSFSDLNNAMKINAGLDVINTVCDYANTYAPIFIDNCEAVNQTLQTNSQQIRLYVTDSDESLRVVNE
ncbi:AAA family ATPase [Amedibacterium intestinale]|uniref:AAA family ATPase n=1 Tax=Amedibacterium intestinale TaxID=2583452 RepID=UPI000E20AA8E